MTTYRKESHIRSLLKGISWRIVATTDTILIVLLITCLQGQCSIDHAIKIGLVEFLLKLLVYYVHERIWQRALSDGVVTKKETLFKYYFVIVPGSTYIEPKNIVGKYYTKIKS